MYANKNLPLALALLLGISCSGCSNGSAANVPATPAVTAKFNTGLVQEMLDQLSRRDAVFTCHLDYEDINLNGDASMVREALELVASLGKMELVKTDEVRGKIEADGAVYVVSGSGTQEQRITLHWYKPLKIFKISDYGYFKVTNSIQKELEKFFDSKRARK